MLGPVAESIHVDDLMVLTMSSPLHLVLATRLFLPHTLCYSHKHDPLLDSNHPLLSQEKLSPISFVRRPGYHDTSLTPVGQGVHTLERYFFALVLINRQVWCVFHDLARRIVVLRAGKLTTAACETC